MKFSDINYTEQQVDTMSIKLVSNPESVDVMIIPNLYGDIISDVCVGLVGGLGVSSSCSIGNDCAVYEATHGTAPSMANKNLANPTGFILASCMMLNDMMLNEYSARIQNAVYGVIREQKWVTKDIGGNSSCSDFVSAVIDKL